MEHDAFPTDVLKHGILPDGQKKRRIDEDLRQAMAIQMVSEKRASSAASMARALGQVSPSLGQAWEKEAMKQYLMNGWSCFRHLNTLSICMDGSRLGCPAEETVTYLCFCPAVNVSMWLPSQVRGQSKQTYHIHALCILIELYTEGKAMLMQLRMQGSQL